MPGRGRTRIGVAVGPREALAGFLPARPGSWVRVGLEPPESSAEGGGWGAELTRAFARIESLLVPGGNRATAGASVVVALLPPLADVRVVNLPPLSAGEAGRILRRDVARYFLGGDEVREVSWRVPPKRWRRGKGHGGQPVFACAVAVGLLEALRAAAEAVGWSLEGVVPAHGAWVAAGSGAADGGVTGVVVVVGEVAHLVRLEGGHPVSVRQVPGGDGEAAAAALGGGPGRVVVFGPPAAREGLRNALAGRGWVGEGNAKGWVGSGEEAAVAFAPGGLLRILPPSMRRDRTERARRTAWSLMVAGAAMVVAAAGTHLWGIHRELSALRDRRAELRAEVAPLLAARDSLELLRGRLESIAALGRTAPSWTRSLVDLAATLPADAYLTGFFASGDTVELAAASARAGEAIQALRHAGLFLEVRLQSAIERELSEGETVTERFRLWARVPPSGGGEP